MSSAPSPFDEPTKPIDVHTLRAWWERQRHGRDSTTSDVTYRLPAPRTSSAFVGPTRPRPSQPPRLAANRLGALQARYRSDQGN
jgi:hypothetical protein